MFEAEKQKGNDLYISVKSTVLTKGDLKTLKEAELHYLKAFTFAQDNDQKSSVQKNLMMVELKRTLYNNDQITQMAQFNSGLVRYYEAKSYASIDECKPKKWLEDLDSLILKYFNDLISKFVNRNYEFTKQISLLSQFKDKIEDNQDQFKIKILFNIIQVQEKIIENFKDLNNYNRAENEYIYYSQNVQNAYTMIENCQEENLRTKIKEKYENLEKGASEFDALRLLGQGNREYSECLKQKAQNSAYKMIDSEDVWIAIDAYKTLIKNYEGMYLIIEGEAFAQLGFIQQEMFGNQSVKFREYIHSSVTLGLTFDSYCQHDWFIKAKQTLKILQNEEIQRDQALRDLWRSQNKQLYDEIVLQKSKGAKSFIQWIMINHKSPNQDDSFAITESDFNNMKKTLLKVIRLYHSDKIIKETDHFKNIAREIMFILNNYFETYK